MSKIRRLVHSYQKYISVPWRDDIAAPQRVVFCVFNEEDERILRAKIEEFEIATKQTGHLWMSFDLTDSFASWLSSQRYARSYFKSPHLLNTLLPKYLDFIEKEFELFTKGNADENTVVAIHGVGSLFGFLKVKELVDKLAPMVKGRLLIFFPGSYDNNNYRLLNGYDGWNYLAVPITADKEF